jgi:hypothetical protein
VGSSGSREAERNSRPAPPQPLKGARSQVAECNGEKTQNGSQHTHVRRLEGAQRSGYPKPLGASRR